MKKSDNREDRDRVILAKPEEREEAKGEEPVEAGPEAEAPASEGLPEAMIEEIPEEEIRRLKDELEKKTREAAENYDRFLRALADLDNYKKRAEKEKSELVNFSNEKLILEILPVIDNLERALGHAEGGHDNIDSLKKGVKLTIESAFPVFVRYGLSEIKAVGEKFDPALHHAISQEETAEAEPGTVVREFQKGYTLKGRLIRPAMVAVAKRPEGK